MTGSASAFIEPASLEAAREARLIYPSAGRDWRDVLSAFADYVDEFRFADIVYRFADQSRFKLPAETGWRLVSTELKGAPDATMEQRRSDRGREYKHIDPAWLVQVYERADDLRRIRFVWRRGFGQYALAEIPDQSLGVFVHRGDSRGEGGSNVFYLANRRKRHEPVSNLFDKLKPKLSNPALIVSDGSNSDIPFLRQFHDRGVPGAEAFTQTRSQDYEYGELRWKCVGYVGPRYGPTLVWQVTTF